VRAGDGRVLVVGGRQIENYYNPDYPEATFLFDPSQNRWSNGPALSDGRLSHGLASLNASSPDIVVFEGGGASAGGAPLRWIGGSSFRALSTGLVHHRWWDWEIGSTLLRNGAVLSLWGWGGLPDGSFGLEPDGEVFNPATENWSSTGATVHLPRYEFSITDLGTTGKALAAGGVDINYNTRRESELYTYAASAPPSSQFCGDAIRDPVREECDLGDGVGSRALCTADCHVRDQTAIVQPTDAAVPPGRTLGEGRHPVAVSASGSFGVVFVEPDAKPLRLSLTAFSDKGVASDALVPISTGSTPLLMSHPVVAAVPGGKYAVAYTDFNGDGDKLGIALRLVDPAAAPTGAPMHANVTTVFSQYDPDLIATASGLVAAWIDDSDASTQPKLKYRTFALDLMPTSGELSLAMASSSASEGDVALANWGSSWVAAWRSDENGLETLRIRSGSTAWSIGTYLPGPVGSRPALAELDATHLLAVYVEGTDPAETGTANDSKLRVVVLDAAAPGAVTPLDVSTVFGAGLSQDQPNAVRAGDQVFIAWRSRSPIGSDAGGGSGDELWLKSIGWNGSTLDLSAAEIPLPRSPVHRAGDQRLVGLASGPLAPVGRQLVTAFDDLGKTFGSGELDGDVVVEAIPIPLLRLP